MKVAGISPINLYDNQNRRNKNVDFQGRDINLILSKDPIVTDLINSKTRNLFSKIWGMLRMNYTFRPCAVLDAKGNLIGDSFRTDVNNFGGRIYLYRLDGNGIPDAVAQETYRKGTLRSINFLDLVTGVETHTYYGGKLFNGNKTITTITRDGKTGRFEGASCKNIDLHNFTVWEKDENGMFTYHDKKNGWLRMTPDKGLQGYLKSDDAIYGFKHIGYPNGYIECRKSDLNTNLIGIFHMPRITGCIEAVLEMFKSGKLQEIMSKNFKQYPPPH